MLLDPFQRLFPYTNNCVKQSVSFARKPVAAVTHGGTIRSLYKQANNKNKRCGMILNTSVNVFHLYEDMLIIKTWGDVSHLSQTEFLQSSFWGDATSG